jgi:Nucleoside diphosphate kinase
MKIIIAKSSIFVRPPQFKKTAAAMKFARSAVSLASRRCVGRPATVARLASTQAFAASSCSSTAVVAAAGLVLATTAGLLAFPTAPSLASCEALPVHGKAGTNQERTFLAVKPDGVQRGLVGDIIARFEKVCFVVPVLHGMTRWS